MPEVVKYWQGMHQVHSGR